MPKINRVNDSIDRILDQEKYQLERANSAALARAAEIDRQIQRTNSHLQDDTTPSEGFPEASSREYQAPN